MFLAFRRFGTAELCVIACRKFADAIVLLPLPRSERRDFIRNTLGLATVPFEQRYCSKQDTCDMLFAICDRLPERACIPDVLMHKIKQ